MQRTATIPLWGFLYLAEGSFSVTAQGDAISAAGALQIDGGTFDLHTGAGSASVDLSSSEDALWPHGRWTAKERGSAE